MVEQSQQCPLNDVDLCGPEPVGRPPGEFADPLVLDVERHERNLHLRVRSLHPMVSRTLPISCGPRFALARSALDPVFSAG